MKDNEGYSLYVEIKGYSRLAIKEIIDSYGDKTTKKAKTKKGLRRLIKSSKGWIIKWFAKTKEPDSWLVKLFGIPLAKKIVRNKINDIVINIINPNFRDKEYIHNVEIIYDGKIEKVLISFKARAIEDIVESIIENMIRGYEKKKIKKNEGILKDSNSIIIRILDEINEKIDINEKIHFAKNVLEWVNRKELMRIIINVIKEYDINSLKAFNSLELELGRIELINNRDFVIVQED